MNTTRTSAPGTAGGQSSGTSPQSQPANPPGKNTDDAGTPGATEHASTQNEVAAPSEEKLSKPRFVHQNWPGLPGYVVIQPNVAYGHQPEAVGLRWLKRRGFTTVLDLRSDSDPAEAPLLRELGLSYVNVPLKADQIWTDKEYGRLKELLTNPRYRPLFIHDKAGERFAAVWVVFRVRESGLSVDAALREVAALKLPSNSELLRRAVESLKK